MYPLQGVINTCHSMVGFLFDINKEGILNNTMNSRDWALFKAGRKIQRNLRKRNKAFNFSKILDRRMKKCG